MEGVHAGVNRKAWEQKMRLQHSLGIFGLHAHRPVGVTTATPLHHQWAHERQNWITGPVSSGIGDIKWTLGVILSVNVICSVCLLSCLDFIFKLLDERNRF